MYFSISEVESHLWIVIFQEAKSKENKESTAETSSKRQKLSESKSSDYSIPEVENTKVAPVLCQVSVDSNVIIRAFFDFFIACFSMKVPSYTEYICFLTG